MEQVPGIPNAWVSAPSLIHMISGTAEKLLDGMRPLLGAPRPAVAHNLGEDVSPSAGDFGHQGRSRGAMAQVGVPNEEREGFVYSSWGEFASKFGLS